MHTHDGAIRLSATDLVNHLSCRHLTRLNAGVAAGEMEPPSYHDRFLELLQKRGADHEEGYIQHLKAQGLEVVRIGGDTIQDLYLEQTAAAMRRGVDVIVQGALAHGRWCGRADILRRIDAPSRLGGWSYEVYDTKLSRETKGGTILQLSLYSDLVERIQGRCPEQMCVVVPWSEYEAESFRTDDYAAYYRLVRRSLEQALDQEVLADTYPDPKPHCDICRWRRPCEQRRRDDDHLCLVAGISNPQIRELQSRGICTTATLATEPLPLAWRPQRGAKWSYERVREQARVQVEGRTQNQPILETLELAPDRGFSVLPEPSPGDMFFDFEGDPFVGEGGLDYLFGHVVTDADGGYRHAALWALTRAEEKDSFERFVNVVMERWAQYSDMHIYHFGPYEPGTMKRLMGRYATREEEVDRMLRADLFVNLHRVVRDGIRASVESYSLKHLEAFYGFRRSVSVQKANLSRFSVQSALELGDGPSVSGEDKATVERSNRDHCVSALRLRDWLERVRAELIESGEDIDRPDLGDGDASEAISEHQEKVAMLCEAIAGDVPVDPEERSDEQQAKWVLANLLDWHRREEKATWWEYFRLAELPADELSEERAALSGLAFIETVGGTAAAPVHRYRFDPQETELRGGESLYNLGGDRLGKLEQIDPQTRTVDIKKRRNTAQLHPAAVYAHDRIPTDVLVDSLLRIGEYVAENGITGSGDYNAARDLLLRQPPRLEGQPVRLTEESALQAALRMAPLLRSTVLPVQGPPGAGKTYTGARMIAELIHCGKQVGITANSHKVIRNLLDAVIVAAQERGISVKAIQKCSERDFGESEFGIARAKSNDGLFTALARGTQVAGGTAWLWSRPEAACAVDVLFVDEAAQMSLANVLAVSQAADSLVLLGDPQQLDQPTKGTHPDGTGVSALAHLLGDRQTIEANQGLFLEETWRLHPAVCDFTSGVFYQGKLKSHHDMETQELTSGSPVLGTGLRLIPVHHEGNRSSSAEEADRVAELFRRLTDGTCVWTNHKGETMTVTEHDVLIITPYNAQVSELMNRLPDARIGTVDKFQGQEAPVVIYSMATSSPEDAPRGMEFLYSLNRLNVATSRARCVCVLVASPKLFEPECHTPRQMKLANAFCRYRELATELTVTT